MRSQLFLFLLFLIGGLSSRTVLAQVVAPSQGGEVGLVLVTATTMEVTFGTKGNGQGRVVAMAPTSGGMPVPLAATDGTVYTANPAYGKGNVIGRGYVVYSGSEHSVTVTGLQPSTYYYITNAEYNTDGTDIAYNTTGSSISTSTRAASTNAAPAPLPVELTAFAGTLDAHNMATLRWSTATEQNTDYFALERSTDGASFAEAVRLAAAGTSTRALAYRWADPQPLLQPTYYRLRQTDRDGATHYSPLVVLTPLTLVRSIDVYPNPGTGTTMRLMVQGYENASLTLRLTDALGRLVMAQTLTPLAAHYTTSLVLPPNLAVGTYFLTLAGGGYPTQKRLTLQN